MGGVRKLWYFVTGTDPTHPQWTKRELKGKVGKKWCASAEGDPVKTLICQKQKKEDRCKKRKGREGLSPLRPKPESGYAKYRGQKDKYLLGTKNQRRTSKNGPERKWEKEEKCNGFIRQARQVPSTEGKRQNGRQTAFRGVQTKKGEKKKSHG